MSTEAQVTAWQVGDIHVQRRMSGQWEAMFDGKYRVFDAMDDALAFAHNLLPLATAAQETKAAWRKAYADLERAFK